MVVVPPDEELELLDDELELLEEELLDDELELLEELPLDDELEDELELDDEDDELDEPEPLDEDEELDDDEPAPLEELEELELLDDGLEAGCGSSLPLPPQAASTRLLKSAATVKLRPNRLLDITTSSLMNRQSERQT